MTRKSRVVSMLVLLFIVILSISITILLVGHQKIYQTHLKLHQPDTDMKNIENLIDETSQLIREISKNKSHSSESVEILRKELLKLNKDHKIVRSEIKELRRSYEISEINLARCIADKSEIIQQKESCEHDKIFHPPVGNFTLSLQPESINNKILPSQLLNSKGKKWLVIGINTVSRKGHEDYLLKALASLATQLPTDPDDLLFRKIVILVVNMQGEGHNRFEEAKQLYGATHEKHSYFRFIDKSHDMDLPDPIPGRNEQNDLGNANHPGFRVRRQTRHIVTVMRQALIQVSDFSYYLFLEDDMRLCHHGFMTMDYLIRKANLYHPNWFAIRASYGMNGVFMRYQDLGVFADYLIKHQHRRPPDHLVVEWYAGETAEAAAVKRGRANIGFRYNFFDHIGMISTLRAQKQGSFPGCYDELLEPVIFQVEAFSPKDCPHDDVWPCNVAAVSVAGPRLDWSTLRHHRSH